jgi:DNA topoisomerase IB
MDSGLVLNFDVAEVPPEQLAAAEDAGLRYVADTGPGFARRRFGDWFEYYDERGREISDDATIERIERLAIPPAYSDVWICPDARGHLQATGRDARGRKQYRYHPDWRPSRDHDKFSRILRFGERLPRLRRRLARDLKLRGLPRDKVLALVVSVLAETLIRVGNHEYARQNNSFGLTTLRNRHVRFRAAPRSSNSAARAARTTSWSSTTRAWRNCCAAASSCRGRSCSSTWTNPARPRPIGSGDVNDYLRDACGEDFTPRISAPGVARWRRSRSWCAIRRPRMRPSARWRCGRTPR